MNYKLLINITLSLLFWLFSFLIVTWLVEGTFWLRFFIASALSGSSAYFTKFLELKEEIEKLNTWFNISDNQLVIVSQKVEEYEERITELESKLSEAEDKIFDLESNEHQ